MAAELDRRAFLGALGVSVGAAVVGAGGAPLPVVGVAQAQERPRGNIPDTPYKIGHMTFFSGPAAVLGEPMYKGQLLAAEEINAQGGLLGRRKRQGRPQPPLHLPLTNMQSGPDPARGVGRRGLPGRGRRRTLAADFERRGWVPEAVRGVVAEHEARQRWAALRRHYCRAGHFLVTNGPYRLARWEGARVVLDASRDLSYPLVVGTFDRYAYPRRAFVTAVERRGDRLEVRAEVETVVKEGRSIQAFTLGCFMAGLGGAIIAPAQSAVLGMGVDALVLAFIVVVIGGLGSLEGALVGAFVVGLVREAGIVFFPEIELAVLYLMAAAVLLARPAGLFGRP